ncbi:hypothetical protein M569_16486 [Genlisea aurea]|uniref:Formin-like protein n=1 Tax=Genlisea aurea TaxID=192259 RepID=S8BVH7_9LAMI|nr:hypothetical protein M569_16486 [Genlisea aurea]
MAASFYPTTFYPPPPPPPLIFPPPGVAAAAAGASESSVRAAVGRAIGATAATTLVLSALVFYLILRFAKRRRDKAAAVAAPAVVGNGGMNQVLPLSDGFVRVNGNFKGVIVAENGLDVLYWRNSDEGGGGGGISFEKQFSGTAKAEAEEEKPRVVNGRERRRLSSSSSSPPPVQEIPLLRGESSTSHSPIWADKPYAISIAIPTAEENPDSAIELTKQDEIPPATTKPSPETPPRGKTIADPPPPPPPGNSSRSSSLGEGSSSAMVSHKFDGDIMEALFGYVATNRKSPRSNNNAPPPQISVLDPHKSLAAAAVLKTLGVSRKEIIDALNDGEGLSSDAMEKLAKMAPTQEESSQILMFRGEDVTRLADAESFLYHLLRALPSAFTRLNVMLFRETFRSEVSQIRESLQSLESACRELRSRGLLLKLLEAVLKAGSRLYPGASSRGGNAQAFNLTALRKLSDVRSSDGRTTLLQFVVQEVIRSEGKRSVSNRNHHRSSPTSDHPPPPPPHDDEEREYMILGLPVIAGLSSEFSNVKRAAATLAYDTIVARSASNLSSRLSLSQKATAQCGSQGGFPTLMKGFFESAEAEMNLIKEEETRVMELVKRTTDYYRVGSSSKDNNNVAADSIQLFVIMTDFLSMVDEVCVGIARNVQDGKSGFRFPSPGSPRVFRFPKLPPNFLSEEEEFQ